MGYEKEDKNSDWVQILSGYESRKGIKSQEGGFSWNLLRWGLEE